VAVVKLDRGKIAEPDGDVFHSSFIVKEEVLDDETLVAESQHEFADAVVSIEFHDMPEYGSSADLDHRLWPHFSFFAKPGALASA
jgi:hypothetical protein